MKKIYFVLRAYLLNSSQRTGQEKVTHNRNSCAPCVVIILKNCERGRIELKFLEVMFLTKKIVFVTFFGQ